MNVEKFLKGLIITGLIAIIVFCSYLLYGLHIADKGAKEEVLSFENAFDIKHQETNISESLLNVEGALYIPSIDVKLPVYTGTDEAALVNGVGIIEGTGDINTVGGNPVLTAHNGLNNSTLLMNLDKMQIKDTFFTRNKYGVIRKYEVIGKKVVDPAEEFEAFLQPGENESLMTLRTCTPTFVNSHRLLVTGREVEFVEDKIPEPTSTTSIYQKILIFILCVAFISLIYIIRRETKEKRC